MKNHPYLLSMAIGKNLRQLRKRAGLTQVELAKLLKLSQVAIANYERDFRKPDIELIPKMAQVLDASLEELFEGPDLNKSFETEKKPHKNSRIARMQKVFEQLGPDSQKNVYQIAKKLKSEKEKG